MKKSLKKYAVIGLAIATLGAGSAGIAFADTKGGMGDLVTKGIISQETADKMADYMDDQTAGRQAEMEKVKGMTESERQVYFESIKEQRTDKMGDMVNKGILTQEEADAIKAAMPQHTGIGKRYVEMQQAE